MNYNYLNELGRSLVEIKQYINAYNRGNLQGPDIQNTIQRAKEKLGEITKKVEVAQEAIKLVNHRKAKNMVIDNPTLFQKRDENGNIDFQGIRKELGQLKQESNALSVEYQNLKQYEEKFKAINDAKKEVHNIEHSKDAEIRYLDSLNQDKVKEFYELKRAYIEAVKKRDASFKALSVQPKGLFARIKSAITYSRRNKENENANKEVADLYQKFINTANGLKKFMPDNEAFDLYPGKNDPAFKELNDAQIGYMAPNIEGFYLVGTSLEEAKQIITRNLYMSPEYNEAVEKYNQLKRENGITDIQLEHINSEIAVRKLDLQERTKSHNDRYIKTLGTADIYQAEDNLGFVEQNMLTSDEEQKSTVFLQQPENREALKEAKERLFEDQKNKENNDKEDQER